MTARSGNCCKRWTATPTARRIFTPDCPYLAQDATFGVKRELVAQVQQIDDPALTAECGMPTPFLLVDWDFVLARAG